MSQHEATTTWPVFLSFYLCRYPDVAWRHNVKMREKEVNVMSTSCDPVTLRLLAESRTMVVSDTGNMSWVLNDFQNICKNLSAGKHGKGSTISQQEG